MNKPDLIQVTDLSPSRGNPLVWENEEPAQGIFLDSGDAEEALALLGTPSLRPPEEPQLPLDYVPGPALRALLANLRESLARTAAGDAGTGPMQLDGLDSDSRAALTEMLGQGEVSGELCLDGVDYTLRESVLTGVWQVTGSDGSGWLEVAPIPTIVRTAADSLRPAPFDLPPPGQGLMNAPAVLAEINEHAANWHPDQTHNRVLNFSLLPMSPADQDLLLEVLGRAKLSLESGGFGLCRVLATRVRHVWAVQFVNAMGHTILDTVEIGRVPDAAVAAAQDFEDSLGRLDDLLDTYLT